MLKAITPLIDRRLAAEGRALCVIDGYCGSGKTTLAEELSRRYDGAPVIHMDDFFLPFPLRTPDRLALPGGNVHHERFAEEVLAGLEAGGGFAYRRFDCATGRLEDRFCPHAPLVIVEGSYSLHPALQPAWQRLGAVTVFLEVAEDEQLRRLARRAPEKLDAFVKRWIPLEKNYFQAYDIREWAQLRLVSPSREEQE
jgi:uridine kinase